MRETDYEWRYVGLQATMKAREPIDQLISNFKYGQDIGFVIQSTA